MNLLLLTTTLIIKLNSDPIVNTNSKPIQYDIQIIHTTQNIKHMDPKLQPITQYLNQSFSTRFQSFKLINRNHIILTKSQQNKEPLPNKTTLSLTYLNQKQSLLQLEITVNKLKTTMKVHNKNLFFQTNRSYKKNILIITIRTKRTH